jgi:ankyrin repeat protein
VRIKVETLMVTEEGSKINKSVLFLYAVLSKRVAMVGLLADSLGADTSDVINKRGYKGGTLLHDVVRSGKIEMDKSVRIRMVQAFVGYGADILAVDEEGKTPFDLAHQGGFAEIAGFLENITKDVVPDRGEKI